MKAEQFVYWLQGHCEMNPNSMPTQEQWDMIKEHLALVFKKETNPLMKFDIPKVVPYTSPHNIPAPFKLQEDQMAPMPMIC